MEVKIDGNPGTGNTFQEVKINYVENYVPNATTVINNHYGDSKKVQSKSEKEQSETDRYMRQREIMQYVGNVKQYVAEKWKNRYEKTWLSILELPTVAPVVYEPGKQKDTTFNRNLIANIIYIMCDLGIITEGNATTLTIALEGDKEHSVRAQLSKEPRNLAIKNQVERLLKE